MLNRLCIFIISLFILSPSFSEEIIVLANGEWPPYHSEHLKHYGFASHIVSEAFAVEGVKVKYDFHSWKRGMEMAKHGELDGTAVWRKKSSFEKDFYYSDPIFETKTVFFHLKRYPFDWTTFDDLKGLYIGGTFGYGYNDDYDRAEKSPEFKIERVKTDKQNFSNLLLGRIDIFPITEEVGYYILKTKFSPIGLDRITHHPKSITPDHEKTLHLLVPKALNKSRMMLKLFNRGLNKLKDNGTIKKYHEKLQSDDYTIK